MDNDAYFFDPYNQPEPGIYLLQIRPEVRVDLSGGPCHGQTYIKNGDGAYVKSELLQGTDLECASGQAADMMVLDGAFKAPAPAQPGAFCALVSKALAFFAKQSPRKAPGM